MSDQFIGQLSVVAFDFPPVGWASAAGQLFPISQNPALFSLLRTTFGGNGTTTFGLPNMQGNLAVGVGQVSSGGNNYVLGEIGGVQNVTLNGTQIPAHTHAAKASAGREAAISNPAGASFFESAAGNVYVIPPAPPAPPPTLTQMSTSITNSFGGNGQHNNMMPFVGMNWIIALQGIFPTRPS